MNAYRYDGFWAPMDTLKERAALEQMYQSGNCPWMPWAAPSPLETPTSPITVQALDVVTNPTV